MNIFDLTSTLHHHFTLIPAIPASKDFLQKFIYRKYELEFRFGGCPKEIYFIQLTFSSPVTWPWLTVCWTGLADKYLWVVGKNNAALSGEYLHQLMCPRVPVKSCSTKLNMSHLSHGQQSQQVKGSRQPATCLYTPERSRTDTDVK